jgi:DNA-binding transcriptional regulator LsrR (DeoR family)
VRKGAASGAKRRRSAAAGIEYDKWEVTSIICRYLCKGLTVKEIQRRVAKKFPDAHLNREDVYAHFREAAKRNWLQYKPPRSLRLEGQIREAYSWLKNVKVVHTAVRRDVALHAAQRLVQLMQDFRKESGKDEIHIGFAGGHSMRALAHYFSDELCEPVEGLPKSVVFHALAAGGDAKDPTTNPNAFFSFFSYKPILQIEPSYMGLSAPTIVTPQGMEQLKQLPDIRAAFAAAKNIDIIVTSGTEWADKDSALKKRIKGAARCVNKLNKEKCLGDIFWRPIGADGPITAETEYRALTLIELGQLHGFIKGGKRVLLMLAPCGGCNKPKGKLLECVLNQKKPLVTDLVVDSLTASQLDLPEVNGVGH